MALNSLLTLTNFRSNNWPVTLVKNGITIFLQVVMKMSRIYLKKPLLQVKMKNPLLQRNVSIKKVFWNLRSITCYNIIYKLMYFQQEMYCSLKYMSLTCDEAFFLAGERQHESRGTGKGRKLTFPPRQQNKQGRSTIYIYNVHVLQPTVMLHDVCDSQKSVFIISVRMCILFGIGC